MKTDRYLNPFHLALINALLITAVYILIWLAASWFYPLKPLPLVITALIVFSAAFLLIRYTLEKFLYNKIRIIYKIIRKQKSAGMPNLKRSDLIDMSKVEKEVARWTEEQEREIDELKKMEIYRREFLGNISHELKTPIFNIQGYILTLLDGGIDDPSINKEYLARSEKSINRMITIVEDLEFISRFESGELKLHRSDFDVVQLAGEVIEMLQGKAEHYKIELVQQQPSTKSVIVHADKEKITQVLTNLLDNSLKYGRPGGSTHVNYFDMDDTVLVEVADNGIGIEQQNLPRLFERFFRTDKARSRDEGGSGLGLAIVKHILEAHGQTINVRSTTGVGTTFGFTLSKAKA